MEEQKRRELRDPASWDVERGETRTAVPSPSAIVSVAFSPAEYEEVTSYARRKRMKTSEFMRKAALDRVRRLPDAASGDG